LREVAACFSVYRTYVSPERDELTELDAALIHTAVDVGAGYRPDLDRGLFDFIEDVLLLRRRGKLETEFLLRFQQFTGPVMAKGFEDTSLYRYARLLAVNEVGSSPFRPEVSVEEFHRWCEEAQRLRPEGMVALGTHDTKRGEDARARLAVLSEVPKEFGEAVERWFALNAKYRKEGWPDANTEYFYYQMLVGSWPVSVERVQLYMQKAAREAKQQTSWTQNNAGFEEQLREFIQKTMGDAGFIAEIEALVKRIDHAGRVNSLSQTLLKCMAPGVPDLYQGAELWDHRLVDPDNRGPVDFDERRRLLEEMQALGAEQVLERMDSGMPKLWMIQRALKARLNYAECFGAEGTYEPVEVRGEKRDHALAFLRGGRVATVVQRLSMGVANGWADTELTLPQGQWSNVLTEDALEGGDARIAELLSRFPVALLIKEN
jgi:(1->4)-alpha-D-glucan 1-alpha-D-glucosylmutase